MDQTTERTNNMRPRSGYGKILLKSHEDHILAIEAFQVKFNQLSLLKVPGECNKK